jgi:hypothetical protein
MMRYSMILGALLVAIFLRGLAPRAQAQVAVQIGPAPVCPYGYYDYAPYNCAPYGYYGPTWFSNGVFIGVGPWFHGGPHFHGWVNNRYDPHYGYHGSFPRRGESDHWDNDHWRGHPEGRGAFRGNEMRDGRGHVVHR